VTIAVWYCTISDANVRQFCSFNARLVLYSVTMSQENSTWTITTSTWCEQRVYENPIDVCFQVTGSIPPGIGLYARAGGGEEDDFRSRGVREKRTRAATTRTRGRVKVSRDACARYTVRYTAARGTMMAGRPVAASRPRKRPADVTQDGRRRRPRQPRVRVIRVRPRGIGIGPTSRIAHFYGFNIRFEMRRRWRRQRRRAGRKL